MDVPDATLAQLYQRLTTLGDALWAQKGGASRTNDPMDLSAAMLETNGKSYAGYKSKSKESDWSSTKCFQCGKMGHIKRFCKQKNLHVMEAEVDQPTYGRSGTHGSSQSSQVREKQSDSNDYIQKRSDFQ